MSFHHKNLTNHRSNDVADREEVLQYFNKKYTFKPPEFGWNLPLETEMFKEDKWELDIFIELKEKLNEVKNKLNNYNLDDWHKHTRAMNKAGNLLWTVKKTIAPEFVTQAWLKFYEICCCYDFVSKSAQEAYYLNSVHLCEAPGAFITSLNHYLKLNHPDLKWDWISTTLNPYHEENPLSIMINDDRFILHTLDHWKFGEDNTGNLMDLNNMTNLVKEAENMGPVLMVTADGSIDCQNNPGEQESIVSCLVYCEIVCALHILAKGGNFVVKMFTMYEEQTICLMYLLVCSFEYVHVFKPASSKEGNSENYVICLNYVGPDSMKPWLRKLKAYYSEERPNKSMFRLSDIPKDFFDQLYECTKIFKNYQVEVIERNIYLFESINNQQSINRTKRLRYALADEYIKRYNLRPLNSKEDEIVGEDKRWEEGSFNDKIEREKMPPVVKVRNLHQNVQKMSIRWEYDEEIKWMEFQTFYTPKSNAVTPAKELSPELKRIIQKSFSLTDPRVRVLNYEDQLWNSLESGQNECCESNVLFDIMDEMEEKMWRGYSLIIQGYPMLTQFTAGVIYLMGHLFEKVGFVRPSGQHVAVIFREYRCTNHIMNNFVRELDSQVDKLDRNKEKSVLSLIPIGELIYKMKIQKAEFERQRSRARVITLRTSLKMARMVITSFILA
ncbi:conserved hypothetical protein [Pediculus humanus corporis]|uniref:Cap-specific mRNA (nucleoside-2'-O-)-methyltransferase 2 n=1 Tax=Pediculus humanus subsp. corporis TaxID=121224 RepID=E0VPC7_PEDHC|nr:uncharacterized protein Phum_PHUM357230 [Pediculus humanus corporis]EEB15233.1 conserved hypothetical protein [Pediculus humanus corporis]